MDSYSRRDMIRQLVAVGMTVAGGMALAGYDADAKGKGKGKGKGKNKNKNNNKNQNQDQPNTNVDPNPDQDTPPPPATAEDETSATPLDEGDFEEEVERVGKAKSGSTRAYSTTKISAANLSIDKIGNYARIKMSMSAQLTTLAQNEIRAGTAVYFFQVTLYEEDNSSWWWGDDTDDPVLGPVSSRAIAAQSLYTTSFTSSTILWSRLLNYGREYYIQVRLYRRDGAGTRLLHSGKSVRRYI